VFETAGTKTVQYKFVPSDSRDYATYTGSVDMTVTKGKAAIEVSDSAAVYGTGADFGAITFTTSPAGLKVTYSTVYDGKTYNNGDIMPAGTYYFTCSVSDDNYASDTTEFKYVVSKKPIDVDFIDAAGKTVTSYSVKYGVSADVGIKLYDANDTSGKSTYLLKDADGIRDTVIYRYVSRTGTADYDSFSPPKAMGSYNLTVTIDHDNYTAVNTVIYKVTIGTVEDISFDTDTLTKQIYCGDAIAVPIVNITPSGVGYYIIYQGYNTTIPEDVGSYNITVYISDDNYETDQVSAVFKINPKPLSVTDITVSDKVYDGVATLEISGQLSGVLYGDEVSLSMEACTFESDPSVGEHYVTITKCAVSGQCAANYTLEQPTYDGKITIYENVVKDTQSGSYIITTSGFESGTAVSFGDVDTSANKTSVWTKMLGVKASVKSFTVTVNGVEKINSAQYKVCVAIPEEYLDADFKVEFGGALEGENIQYRREGNYVTFYTSSSSGEVVFSDAEFKYGYVVAGGILVIVLIAVIVMFILNPIRKKRQFIDPSVEKNAIREIRKGQ
jgi:hypothetical protein